MRTSYGSQLQTWRNPRPGLGLRLENTAIATGYQLTGAVQAVQGSLCRGHVHLDRVNWVVSWNIGELDSNTAV